MVTRQGGCEPQRRQDAGACTSYTTRQRLYLQVMVDSPAVLPCTMPSMLRTLATQLAYITM